MRAKQENFAILDDDIGFFQLRTARAYGFDFPALQDDASFVLFLDKIIVECFFLSAMLM
ncbi:hypothetical protein UNDYM_2778 [Undibacterium sp. YM2]|nr:hypothetical protein UNDYM_2778 [Undibacterium sp. YM2]